MQVLNNTVHVLKCLPVLKALEESEAAGQRKLPAAPTHRDRENTLDKWSVHSVTN